MSELFKSMTYEDCFAVKACDKKTVRFDISPLLLFTDHFSECRASQLLAMHSNYAAAVDYATQARECVLARVADGRFSKHHPLNILASFQAGAASYQEINHRFLTGPIPMDSALFADSLLVRALRLATFSLRSDHPIIVAVNGALLKYLQA